MTQAEKETIDTFCQELALALRRITGHQTNLASEELPVVVPEPPADQSAEHPDMVTQKIWS